MYSVMGCEVGLLRSGRSGRESLDGKESITRVAEPNVHYKARSSCIGFGYHT
jgi:hypothetical protein